MTGSSSGNSGMRDPVVFTPTRVPYHPIDTEDDLTEENCGEKSNGHLRAPGKAREHCTCPPHNGAGELHLPFQDHGGCRIGTAEHCTEHGYHDVLVNSAACSKSQKDKEHRDARRNPDCANSTFDRRVRAVL